MLRELVLANRSYRGYDSSCEIGYKELLDLVDIARFTASSMNKQALKFYISSQKEEVAKLVSFAAWAAMLKDRRLPYRGKEPSAAIVICQDTKIAPAGGHYMVNAGIAAQTILLAAVERGLGGCINASFDKQKLCSLLAFPDNIEPVLLLAIGKPAEKIVLTEVGEDGSTAYYRDGDDVHYVPKRLLDDIMLSRGQMGEGGAAGNLT